jgi:hypothetical protein
MQLKQMAAQMLREACAAPPDPAAPRRPMGMNVAEPWFCPRCGGQMDTTAQPRMCPACFCQLSPHVAFDLIEIHYHRNLSGRSERRDGAPEHRACGANMSSMVPPHLIPEQAAVEAAIRAAFKGVGRAGGVSWSEAWIIDDYGNEEECAAARARDTERSWEDLVDDPNWDDERGVGGFSFLDAIGFAYYIAPAMVRDVRRGCSAYLAFTLDIGGFRRTQVAALDEAQGAAIARFLRFMIATCEADGDDDIGVESWRRAYDSHWRQFDRGQCAC